MNVRLHTVEELLARMRTVRLTGLTQPLIYPDGVFLALESLSTSLAVPCQLYYLESRVEQLRELYSKLIQENEIDFLKMRDLVTGRLVGWMDVELTDGEWMPLLPPVVETDARGNYIINDGIHRIQFAREMGCSLRCVLTGIPDWPYYALPNPNRWDDVKSISGELPEGFVKKHYRLADKALYKQLFRDFNAVWPGVQKERAKGAIV